MKRKITLSIALTLSVVVLSLMKSDSTTNAAPQRYKFSSGVVTLAVGQTLRVTVAAGDVNGNGLVRFMWAQYLAGVCSGMPPVCRHTIDSQGSTPVIALGNDALSFDVPGNGNGVNVAVVSNGRNVLVNFFIIDDATGKVVAATDGHNGAPGNVDDAV